jgi:hypothetical protein
MNWPAPDSWPEKRARGWLLTGQKLVPGHLNSPTMTLTPYAEISQSWLSCPPSSSAASDIKLLMLERTLCMQRESEKFREAEGTRL